MFNGVGEGRYCNECGGQMPYWCTCDVNHNICVNWIAVKDKLPQESYKTRLLAYGWDANHKQNVEPRIEICKFDEGIFIYTIYDLSFIATHWTHLPLSPETGSIAP